MKNLFLVAVVLFSFLVLGCGASPTTDGPKKPSKDYTVVIIGECEYIEFNLGFVVTRIYSLTHKGDCKNPIHSHNK